ncbi:DUF1385 domain-containing protein [Anaerosporobacter faecicola]|uniref:DUF1385 domain-containing protein n=1 Tax=Anaerosporobacter faecicola TaxID=2718714 RepID=UPI00143C634C
MKSSGIGGQAVLEGVMMKNQDEYAVAVRIPNNEIIVQKNKYVSVTKRFPILGLPIVRGVANFIESMVIGTKTLTFSSSFFEEEEEKTDAKNGKNGKQTKNTNNKKEKTVHAEKANEKEEKAGDGLLMALTICASILLAVGIFMLLPFLIGNLLSEVIESSALLALVEGVIRIVIFIAYIVIISQMKDIRRVFMYHGAEHKTINCIEHGLDLTVENVRWQSKEHKRCGTSFMLIVMVISVIFFIFIRVDTIWLRMLYRVLLVPVIAGVSYEFIRLAGRSESKVVAILSKPGLWLQGLTTREPDDDMIEVAIKSVEAVFDWKKYLEENADQWKNQKRTKEEVNSDLETAATLEKENVDENHNSVQTASTTYNEEDEEDDEILRALDRYFETPAQVASEQNKKN